MTVKTFLLAAALVAVASSAYAADEAPAREAGQVQVAMAGEAAVPAQADTRPRASAKGDSDTLPGGTGLLLACLACIGFLATRRSADRR